MKNRMPEINPIFDGRNILQHSFTFDTASELIRFIESLKPFIIGQSINAVYAPFFYTNCTDEEMPFVILDRFAVGVFFFSESGVEIVVADKADFKIGEKIQYEETRKVSYNSKLANTKFNNLYWDPTCPVKTARILDIIVDRHSDEIESDVSDSVREKGGDYFSSIRFLLEGGFELLACYDGYEYTYIGYSNLPKTYLHEALQKVPVELDSSHELWYLVEVTKISPDELAQEAIDYIERCAKAGYWAPGIAGLLRTFHLHGMNPDYVSNNGDTLFSVIPKLGPKGAYTLEDYQALCKK